MLLKRIISGFFIFCNLLTYGQNSCETALEFSDSLKLEATSQETWLKVPPDTSKSFSFKTNLKDIEYIIYQGSASFCSRQKRAVSVFSSTGKLPEVAMVDAELSGKCICYSCLTSPPVLINPKDFTYIKILPHKESITFYKTLLREEKPKEDALRKDIKPGTKVAVTNILFQSNSNVFLPESKQPLEILYIFLQKNPGIKIEIQGHVNAPGPQIPEDQILSEKRAKAIYDYLIKEGIPKERISHKGFGNQFMLYPKPKNEFQMMMNRRVEILILENKEFTSGG